MYINCSLEITNNLIFLMHIGKLHQSSKSLKIFKLVSLSESICYLNVSIPLIQFMYQDQPRKSKNMKFNSEFACLHLNTNNDAIVN